MLHHRTTNPAQRAADIADRCANKVWREQDPPCSRSFAEIWLGIYNQVIREFCLV
ncbi:MAG: hypothetical protein WCW56_02210 [Candidatus Paceibacterota bacterium]|jgi:hypothetical protein